MSRAPDEQFSLTGRRVLVTGAGRGLGQGIALAAVQAGADVVGVARSADQLTDTAGLASGVDGSFSVVPADLSRVERLDTLIERLEPFSPFHGVVHAAGNQLRKSAHTVSYEEWRRVLELHLDAPFFLSMALLRRQLDEVIPASHVFVGSLASTIGLRRVAPYAAAKSALSGLARTLALEYAESGVRFNVLSPGYFHTQLTNDLLSDPTQHERVLSRIPMKRLGVAGDLAGSAIYLLSDASRYVTGQVLNVDGGWLAG
jgi:2-deoxy-D-gluconate 3-dehydrogenase